MGGNAPTLVCQGCRNITRRPQTVITAIVASTNCSAKKLYPSITGTYPIIISIIIQGIKTMKVDCYWTETFASRLKPLICNLRLVFRYSLQAWYEQDSDLNIVYFLNANGADFVSEFSNWSKLGPTIIYNYFSGRTRSHISVGYLCLKVVTGSVALHQKVEERSKWLITPGCDRAWLSVGFSSWFVFINENFQKGEDGECQNWDDTKTTRCIK